MFNRYYGDFGDDSTPFFLSTTPTTGSPGDPSAGYQVPSWDQPGSDSYVNVTDPSTGTVSTVPYYLANDVPPPEVPAHGYDPAQQPGVQTPAGTVSQNPQGVPGDTTSGFSLTSVLKTAANLVGRFVSPSGAVPYPPVPVAQPMPIWPWVLGGVAVVGVIAVVISSRKSHSMSGYRRKSKRSRR